MGEGFFLSGLAANACVQAQSVTVSSEDSLFPKANLQNGKPWEPFRFGSLAANQTIDFDCNVITNSSFETDPDATSPPSGWQTPTGGGSPDVSTVAANEGTKSLRLNSANEAAFQDREVRPGGTFRHTVALRGDGTAIVSAYIIDLLSGKYLQAGGGWTTTKTAWATRSAGSFATSSITFTLEAPAIGHVGPGRIRVYFDRPGSVSAAAYVDSVYLWPKITCAALLFDTIPSGFTVAVHSDDNSSFSSVTNNGSLPAGRFRRYLTFAGPGTPERYWRFAITGTPFDLYRPWIGQTVLGERRTFTTKPQYGFVSAREMPKAGSELLPASLAQAPRYRLEMNWITSHASFRELAEEMLGSSSFGDEPVMIAPDIANSEFVYGRGLEMSSVSPSWTLTDLLEYSLAVNDDPYPVFTK